MSIKKLVPLPFVEFLLKKYSKPDCFVLDVGCGPAIYRNTINGKYIGLDINKDSYFDLTGQRRMDTVASAASLPFKDNTFDLLFAKSAFYQFEDPLLALFEFKRVLKADGRLLLIDYNMRTQKRIQKKEMANRPCWTQNELKKIVEKSGFRCLELLLALPYDTGSFEKKIRLFLEELIGLWAIVTAVK